MVARMLAPVTRATPVPTNKGTSRVSRAGGKEGRLCSECVMVLHLLSHRSLPEGGLSVIPANPQPPISALSQLGDGDAKGCGKRTAREGRKGDKQVGRGWLSLTMRVGVDRDGPGARTACLVPAIVSVLHPGAGCTVVYAFVLGPQAVQSQPMTSGSHQLHTDRTPSRPDSQLCHTVLTHSTHKLSRTRAQFALLWSLHPPAGC